MDKRCIFALFLLFPALLQGQETGLLRLDRKQRTPRSEVALWSGFEDGRFRPASAAIFQWSAGTEARLVRHGARSSWFGNISLEQMTGKYRNSSLFAEPDYFPMDLLDFTAGRGSRQTGLLEAGVLGDLSDIWAAGVRASVKAVNDAKRTAVRHSSFGTDLQLEPVVTFVSDDDACIVSSYLVCLRTEKVKAGGEVFFDKGLCYGAYEPGLSLFPVLEFAHGFNEEYHSPDLSAGVGIVWKRGRAGEVDYSRFRFPGSTLKGFFETVREGFSVDRTYRISYQRMRDQLREVRDDGDGYGTDSDRVGRNLAISFGLQPHRGSLKRVSLDLDGNHWSERAVAHPIWDRTRRVDATATLRALFSGESSDVDLGFLLGKGAWIDRGYAGKDAETEPYRQLDHWFWKTEYQMAPRFGLGGTVTSRVPAIKGLSLQFHAWWLRAFYVTHLGGRNREILTVKVAYQY